jgi:hypothetical protein
MLHYDRYTHYFLLLCGYVAYGSNFCLFPCEATILLLPAVSNNNFVTAITHFSRYSIYVCHNCAEIINQKLIFTTRKWKVLIFATHSISKIVSISYTLVTHHFSPTIQKYLVIIYTISCHILSHNYVRQNCFTCLTYVPRYHILIEEFTTHPS